MNNLLRAFVLAAVVAFPLAGVAQQGLKLTMASFQEVVTTSEDGSQETRRVPVTTVLPGNEVIYVITYSNVSDKPITNAVISNPLPAQVSYVAGSAASEGADFQVSVDGGANFGVLASLRVKDADGERPARPSDVTHLRWTVAGNIPPGTEGTVSYRAVLK